MLIRSANSSTKEAIVASSYLLVLPVAASIAVTSRQNAWTPTRYARSTASRSKPWTARLLAPSIMGTKSSSRSSPARMAFRQHRTLAAATSRKSLSSDSSVASRYSLISAR